MCDVYKWLIFEKETLWNSVEYIFDICKIIHSLKYTQKKIKRKKREGGGGGGSLYKIGG